AICNNRIWASVEVSCGKLFVTGGYANIADYTAIKTLESMEMYDPETDTWQEISSKRSVSKSISLLHFILHYMAHLIFFQAIFVSSHSSGFPCFLLMDEILRVFSDCGYVNPSKVQHEFIPRAMHGFDLNCQAKSGSGKTTSYVIATLQQLDPIEGDVSTLIMCRTQELASKISEEYAKLAKYLAEINIAVFCGDTRAKKNRGLLKNNCPHIVIGTPGRILALGKSGALKLNKIKHFVVDECDRILAD
ncbi:hypothetical protein PENTCL1PPCAC_21568, partial [Pristionchus entomophagus]